LELEYALRLKKWCNLHEQYSVLKSVDLGWALSLEMLQFTSCIVKIAELQWALTLQNVAIYASWIVKIAELEWANDAIYIIYSQIFELKWVLRLKMGQFTSCIVRIAELQWALTLMLRFATCIAKIAELEWALTLNKWYI
jgi:hypothetical protein